MLILPFIGVVFSFFGVPIFRSLSFLYIDQFEGNADISAAIKSGSAVYCRTGNFRFLKNFQLVAKIEHANMSLFN